MNLFPRIRSNRMQVCLVFWLGCSTSLMAQWTPMTARIEETNTVRDKNGQVVHRESKAGRFYRDSHGSTMIIWADDNGKDATAELVDNQACAMFTIDLTRKQAIERRQMAHPLSLPSRPLNSKNSLGEDSFEGVACTWVPVYGTEQSLGKGEKLIGKACTTKEMIVLSEETSMTFENTDTLQHSKRMFQLQSGTEPDAALFRIDRSFRVLTPGTAVSGQGCKQSK